MADKLRVSQSKVKTFRRCHRAYYNKYVRGLVRKRVARPLMFGRIIHEMVEAHANGDDPFRLLDMLDFENTALFAAEREEYGDIVEDARLIMTDYFAHWDDNDLQYIRRKGRSAEHEFEIEIIPDVIWNGKIDAVARTPNKLRWLVEHKTFTRMPGDDERWRNLQSVTYFRALDIMGWKPVDGTCWDYIKSKPPARPGLLQNGQISQKAIDSLPSAIEAAIIENNEDPEAYEKFLNTIALNRRSWFQRIHTPVSRQVADLVWEDFEATIRRMVDDDGKSKDMNVERHCGWCDYEPLCRAELQGLDVEYVEQREYRKDDKTTKPSDVKAKR